VIHKLTVEIELDRPSLKVKEKRKAAKTDKRVFTPWSESRPKGSFASEGTLPVEKGGKNSPTFRRKKEKISKARRDGWGGGFSSAYAGLRSAA